MSEKVVAPYGKLSFENDKEKKSDEKHEASAIAVWMTPGAFYVVHSVKFQYKFTIYP